MSILASRGCSSTIGAQARAARVEAAGEMAAQLHRRRRAVGQRIHRQHRVHRGHE